MPRSADSNTFKLIPPVFVGPALAPRPSASAADDTPELGEAAKSVGGRGLFACCADSDAAALPPAALGDVGATCVAERWRRSRMRSI